MQAIIFQGKKTLACERAAEPEILTPDDAIVRVAVAAICGSDLHVYHGREAGLDPGTVMGHEFVGEVVAVGKNVQHFRSGERVFSPFFSACGRCFFCRHDLSCRCERGHLFGWVEQGRGLQGAQAEFVRVPLADTTLSRIPGDVTWEEALLLCDILPTGFFGADMAMSSRGKNVAVVGCGPVGLLAILGLREFGAENVFAIDFLPERLGLAERFGAIPVRATEPVREIVWEQTQRPGVDAVLEAVGSAAAQKLAIELVRPGGVIATVGVHTRPHFSFSPVDLYNKNLTYKTGRCPVQRYLPRLIPLVQQQKYDVTAVISHRLPLREGVVGYRIFDEKQDQCTKVLLIPCGG